METCSMGTCVESAIECQYGHLLNVSVDVVPGEIVVRDVNQFSLGRIFRSLLRSYPGRVDDPLQADLLFVDAFTEVGSWTYRPWLCENHNPILELKHLHRGNAHKHVLISPRCAGSLDVCPWFNSHRDSSTEEGQLFAKMFKLALEDPASYLKSHHHNHQDRRDNGEASMVDVYSLSENGTIQFDKRWKPPIAANLHSIPYPSFRSGLLARELEEYKAVVAGARRTYLASAVWGTHGTGQAIQQRQTLQKQCNSSDDCIFVDLGLHHTCGSRCSQDAARTVVSTMLKSKFCLQPEGDTLSRKAIIDALTLGCIPVLVTERQKKLWPWHVNWDDVSVQADYKANVLDYLRNIPESEIKHKQSEMRKLSDLISYGESDQGHHALDVVLEAFTASSMTLPVVP
jgi:hypothetical protein